MAVEVSNVGPYAPVQNVLSVIRRRRDGRLPDQLGADELARMGIPQGNISRTLATLRFLGLVEENGEQTSEFARLGRVSEQEYPDVLAEIIQGAYAPVFQVADPTTADDRALNDAFRYYKPEAQRARMITLFRGLCEEAGLMERSSTNDRAARRPGTSQSAKKNGPATAPRERAAWEPGPSAKFEVSMGWVPNYQLLEKLLNELPKDAKWSQARRDRWLRAVEANLDLLVEVVEPTVMQPDPSTRAVSDAIDPEPAQQSEFDNMPF